MCEIRNFIQKLYAAIRTTISAFEIKKIKYQQYFRQMFFASLLVSTILKMIYVQKQHCYIKLC